jgi:hypothetical protein
MHKKLTKNEIDQIKFSLKPKLDRDSLRVIRDNFFALDEVMKSKMELDTWTEKDKKEVLEACSFGCKDSSNKICRLIHKEFRDFVGIDNEYDITEICECCLFNSVCSGSSIAKGDDQWHRNICLIWGNILKDFDLKYIKNRWKKINRKYLQDLNDIVENF